MSSDSETNKKNPVFSERDVESQSRSDETQFKDFFELKWIGEAQMELTANVYIERGAEEENTFALIEKFQHH